MRLEHIPLIIGVIVALIGLGFIADASMAASAAPTPERRRRMRAEPSRAGEAFVGIGTLCMAAALFGRDTWRYGTVAVLTGSGLLLIGIILNRTFLKEALLFRGPVRRREGGIGGGAGAPPRPAARPNPAGSKPAVPPIVLGARPSAATVDTSASRAPSAAAPRAPQPQPVVERHPTPPLASPAYRAPNPVPPAAPTAPVSPAPTPAPVAETPPVARPRGPDRPPPPPAAPKERRKSPRGKK